MLRFESVFWAVKNPDQLVKKLGTLGFNVAPSPREPGAQTVYFGPEAIEIFDSQQKPGMGGIFGLSLESDDIATDYHRLKAIYPMMEKPKQAQDNAKDVPLWYGFTLPDTHLGLCTWVMMNSPFVLQQQAAENLPVKHPNTCFGIEAVHVLNKDPEATAKKWTQVLQRANAGLHWSELGKTQGKRLQAGERFLDFLALKSNMELAQATKGSEGVAMLTLKVADLELAKDLVKQAGAQVVNCNNRDGFIVPNTGGPALRFVRAFWKRYLPTINDFFPFKRRPDKWRPLGGADNTTLLDDFKDNWKY